MILSMGYVSVDSYLLIDHARAFVSGMTSGSMTRYGYGTQGRLLYTLEGISSEPCEVRGR